MTALTAELAALQCDVEAEARAAGLDVPEIVYEVVDHEELNEIAALSGFPVRYSHWRFGMEYDRLQKSYRWGLHRIYELVVNTRPVIAYLLEHNPAVDQKLVMAHVCGHADFFVHNAWFAHTDPDFIDASARHAARVRALSERHGFERVESLIDVTLSLDNLVDAAALARGRGHPGNAPPLSAGVTPGDLLGHLILRAPLESWEQEILALVRDEAYYFLPQAMTKIMNEGWASFWHSRLMTGTLLRDAEVIDYADHHASAMGGTDGPLNPYKLGIELFRSVVEESGGGLEAAFDARAIHDDLTFVDEYLTLDFARRRGLAEAAEDFATGREALLRNLTNAGQPLIRLREGAEDETELELEHLWSGRDLQIDVAEETLRTLCRLWRGRVRLHTRLQDRALLLTCDGDDVTREPGERLVEPEADDD